MPAQPILYSFRRCPYAMRARMTLSYCGIGWEHREVLLKDKPAQMLQVSPKGTVPVLVLPAQTQTTATSATRQTLVIDESIDIMHWALDQNDPHGWRRFDSGSRARADALVEQMQQRFKPHLDGYKYGNRLPDAELRAHRDECEQQLAGLNTRLEQQAFLFGPSLSFVDVAWFPFVRQFANVDRSWFDELAYPHLQGWLGGLLDSDLFARIMTKHTPWQPA